MNRAQRILLAPAGRGRRSLLAGPCAGSWNAFTNWPGRPPVSRWWNTRASCAIWQSRQQLIQQALTPAALPPIQQLATGKPGSTTPSAAPIPSRPG